MRRPSDELLIAFLDGELDDARADEVAAWLARDPSLRARLSNLCEATVLLRAAFEPAPEAILPRPVRTADPTVIRFGRMRSPRWWIGLAMAASFLLGLSLNRPGTDATIALPGDLVRPDLKPWGLTFVSGGRLLAEGKPAVQFSYVTDNKELGPITLFVTESTEPDAEATFDTRDGVNVLYWRHRGHGYSIVGGANDGWLWKLHNDIGYQLKAM